MSRTPPRPRHRDNVDGFVVRGNTLCRAELPQPGQPDRPEGSLRSARYRSDHQQNFDSRRRRRCSAILSPFNAKFATPAASSFEVVLVAARSRAEVPCQPRDESLSCCEALDPPQRQGAHRKVGRAHHRTVKVTRQPPSCGMTRWPVAGSPPPTRTSTDRPQTLSRCTAAPHPGQSGLCRSCRTQALRIRTGSRTAPGRAGSTPVIDGPQSGHLEVSVSKAQTSSVDAAIRRDTEKVISLSQ